MERNNPEIKLHGNDKRNGYKGVILLGAVTALWDFSDNETITSFVERQVYHEDWKRRVAILGSLAYIGAHLCDKVDTRVDLFDNIGRGAEKLRDAVVSWTTRGAHLP